MIKSMNVFFLLVLSIQFFSGNIYGQKTVLAEEGILKVEEDIFGGNYEYISGEVIVSERIISDGAIVDFKSGKLIKLTDGFKVEKNCQFRARIIKTTDVEEEIAQETQLFEIYPNVSAGNFTINFGNCSPLL